MCFLFGVLNVVFNLFVFDFKEVVLSMLSKSDAMHGHYQDCDAYTPRGRDAEPDNWRACADFPRFGAGTENFSWFEVSLSWSDLEGLIHAFSLMDHPGVKHLQRARKLAGALDEFSQNSAGSAP
ncbi:hypothetical protein [uncultured Rhodoblastus sp.]|uniref:hypothetical protein n=1 Tax=uncultured Rhodoblastus sp. TaxID=543037 RepID=UPI0025CE8FE2|nr:hypothetical protein [uncultured Rhodoblastus sp.]